jgi:hypothetical protein
LTTEKSYDATIGEPGGKALFLKIWSSFCPHSLAFARILDAFRESESEYSDVVF